MKPSEIHDVAKSVLDDAIRLRRRLHRHPELGLTLPRTQAAVLEALDGLGLEVQTGQRTTSVVARLRGARPGPTILLRADMDALPMPRSEEHTSELQSRPHLVCRLLLEKKKHTVGQIHRRQKKTENKPQ